MNPTQTRNGVTPENGELGQATVRELIVQLALVEDEHRNTAVPGQLAALPGASKQPWKHCTCTDMTSKAHPSKSRLVQRPPLHRNRPDHQQVTPTQQITSCGKRTAARRRREALRSVEFRYMFEDGRQTGFSGISISGPEESGCSTSRLATIRDNQTRGTVFPPRWKCLSDNDA